MKKNVLAMLLVGLLTLTTGCNSQNEGSGTPPIETENLRADAIAGADSPSDMATEAELPISATPCISEGENIYTPESLQRLPELTDDELILYAAGSDGAYAEGAGSELYKRFIKDPDGILALISELERTLQSRVCTVLAGEAVIGEHSVEFESILGDFKNDIVSTAETDTLELLRTTYQLMIP